VPEHGYNAESRNVCTCHHITQNKINVHLLQDYAQEHVAILVEGLTKPWLVPNALSLLHTVEVLWEHTKSTLIIYNYVVIACGRIMVIGEQEFSSSQATDMQGDVHVNTRIFNITCGGMILQVM
jgi:hypothetical protein